MAKNSEKGSQIILEGKGISSPAQYQIKQQLAIEGVKQSPITAISTPAGVAQDHTPVYLVHRYFARRPHNVFSYLVSHYSQPGDIILDPFMGGGVTVVEALRLKRKVIGVDLNPLAWFVSREEVANVDLTAFEAIFEDMKIKVGKKINAFYQTDCHVCGNKKATAEWYEWSDVIRCPSCGNEQVLKEAKKLAHQGGGKKKDQLRLTPKQEDTEESEEIGEKLYECSKCKTILSTQTCEIIAHRLCRVKVSCPKCKTKGFKTHKNPSPLDFAQWEKVKTEAEKLLPNLFYPEDVIPTGDETERLLRRHIKHFREVFTTRNLLALSLLLDYIAKIKDSEQRKIWALAFSSALWRVSKFAYFKSDGRIVNAGHHYWLPDIPAEENVWHYFVTRRVTAIRAGKQYSSQQIGSFFQEAQDFQALKSNKTCFLLNRSSTNLPIPDNSADVVITDPPFGGNVNYGELSDFCTVWLHDIIGLPSGVLDKAEEALINKTQGKDENAYEELLYRVFKECHRVLKADSWMVLTFHNRDPHVWMSLHRAALRAGFRLPSKDESANRGIIYQPPIEEHTTTLHQQAAGAMLGDFILSFRRKETTPLEIVSSVLSTTEEDGLKAKTEELIRFHGGADQSTLMTGLIPYLGEQNLFHKLAGVDFSTFFGRHFVKQSKKWFTPDMIDETTKAVKPLDFVPAEHLTEGIVYSFLRVKKFASLDEILLAIYTQLVNSHRPGVTAISKVLQKICKQVPLPGQAHRQGFTLKPTSAVDTAVSKPEVETQLGLFGTPKMVTSLSHNEIIELVYSYATDKGYEVHIGETEQNKEPKFKRISRQMTSNIEFGLPPSVFNSIIEIDMLLLKVKGSGISHAFEVTTTVETANKAVNDRYRNMFIAMPSLNIKAFLIVKDKDAEKAHQIVYSTANVKDGISKKIAIVRLSDLTKEKFEQLLT